MTATGLKSQIKVSVVYQGELHLFLDLKSSQSSKNLYQDVMKMVDAPG
jgi:hypothetical protein